MSPELVKDIGAEVLKTTLVVSAPVLIVSLLVGVLVSFIQAITQIQEFTLTFVPKIIAVFLCLFILLPWLSSVLVSFTQNIIHNIPLYVK
ncbi:MAG: flagellar biosynthetic protein FliQ [Nitrospirae bacterium]|nr:MAG: flagellar biosynthetic protein FliQ [Nitrospirota bacterium]